MYLKCAYFIYKFILNIFLIILNLNIKILKKIDWTIDVRVSIITRHINLIDHLIDVSIKQNIWVGIEMTSYRPHHNLNGLTLSGWVSATAWCYEKPQKRKKRSIWVKRPHQRVEAMTSLVPTATAVVSDCHHNSRMIPPVSSTQRHQILHCLACCRRELKSYEQPSKGTRFHITGLWFPQYGQSSSNCLIVQSVGKSWIRHLIQTNVSLSSSLILVICVIVFSLDCRSYAEPAEYIIECDDILVMNSPILQRQ